MDARDAPQLEAVMEGMDTDHDGRVSFEEFRVVHNRIAEMLRAVAA